MKVVSNTSPLIALAKLGELRILSKLFQKVLIPQAVTAEFWRNSTVIEKSNF